VQVLGSVEYAGTCCYPYPDAKLDTFNAPGSFDHLLGKTSDTEIVEKPADKPSDTLLLSQLADALEENDRLAAMLASEQARSEELQAKIDSFRAAINSIIK